MKCKCSIAAVGKALLHQAIIMSLHQQRHSLRQQQALILMMIFHSEKMCAALSAILCKMIYARYSIMKNKLLLVVALCSFLAMTSYGAQNDAQKNLAAKKKA